MSHGDYTSQPGVNNQLPMLVLDVNHDSHWTNLPLGNQLLDAQFSRIGGNLLIKSEDITLLLQHYFHLSEAPGLVSETGKKISASAVETLVGSNLFQEFAGPTASESIGVIEKLQGTVEATRHGQEITLHEGDPVFLEDVIHTSKESSVGITFNDESVFTLGPDARMTLDHFVYDPETGDGSSSVNVIKGMFKFVSGDIAANNPGDMKVETPVATIGIRGTTGGGVVEGNGGQNQFFLEPNADGTVGWFDVTTAQGTSSMNQANTVVSVSSFNEMPSQPFVVPPSQLQQQFGTVIEFSPEGKYDVRQDSITPDSQQNNQPNAVEGEQHTNQAQPAAAQEKNAANAEMQTEQSQDEHTQGSTTKHGDKALEAFSGDAQFDGQSEIGFIPVGVASENQMQLPHSGFDLATTQNFETAPNLSSGLTQNSVLPLSLFSPSELTGLATTQTGTLPVGQTNSTATPPPLNPTLIGQLQGGGITPPQGGVNPPSPPPPAPPPPSEPPAPPPPAPPPPPPTTPPVGGGGNTPPGQFILTSIADNFVGGAVDNLFLVNLVTHLAVNDTLIGAGGVDTIEFAPQGTAYTITASQWMGASGIDRIKINDDLATLNFDASLFESSDNKKVYLDSAAHNIAVNTSNLSPLYTLFLEGTGAIDIGGTGPLVLGNEPGTAVNWNLVGPNSQIVGIGISGGSNSITNATAEVFMNQNGGTGHTFNLGNAHADIVLEDIIGTTTTHVLGSGGGYGRSIDIINSANVDVAAGDSTAGHSHYFLEGTQDVTVHGGVLALDQFEIWGENTALQIYTNNWSVGGGYDDILFNNFSGTASVFLNSGQKVHIDSFSNSDPGSIILARTGSATDMVKLDTQGTQLEDYSISVTDTDSNGQLDFVLEENGSPSHQIILKDFYQSINNSKYQWMTESRVENFPLLIGLPLNELRSLNGSQYLNYAEGEIHFNAAPADGDTLQIVVNNTSYYVDYGAAGDVSVTGGLQQIAHDTAVFLNGLGLPNIKINLLADNDIYIHDQQSGRSSTTIISTAGSAIQLTAMNFNDYFTARGSQAAHWQDTLSLGVTGSVLGDHLESGINYQTLEGGDGSDVLYASHDYVSLSGGAGNDLFVKSTAVADTNFYGAEGADIVSYSLLTTPLVISMSASAESTVTGSGFQDLLTGVEGIIGGSGNDSFSGSSNDEWFMGGAGADFINGGTGIDTASYESSAAAVNINLSASSQQGGDAQGDYISLGTIENIIGSTQDDIIVGDANANTLWGLSGADSILGGAGNDTIRGGVGAADTVNGGAGDDVIQLELGGFTLVNGYGTGLDILDISLCTKEDLNYFDLIRMNRLSLMDNGVDAEIHVKDEMGSSYEVANIAGVLSSSLSWSNFKVGKGSYGLSGTESSDVVFANSNTVSGYGGNDILSNNGMAGVNYIGGEGDDVLVISNLTFNATLNGGSGTDTLYLEDTVASGFDLGTFVASHSLIGIDRINLNGLSAANISWEDVNAISDDKELYIDGTGSETITLDPNEWHLTTAADGFLYEPENGYNTYISKEAGATPVLLHIQDNITVS